MNRNSPRIPLLVVVVAVISFLAGSTYRRQNPSAQVSASGRRILYFRDPMHPGYKTDKPGIAPDCGMRLEPVYADSAVAESTEAWAALPPGTVSIPADKQQLMGIRVEPAQNSSFKSTVRVLGRVATDEARVYRINAATDGWIRATFPNTVGTFVKKDEKLVAFYSPEFLGAEQAYLYALSSLDRFQGSGKETPEQIKLTKASVQQAVDSLRNMGMGDLQIQGMERTRELTQSIFVYAPADGFIVARNISLGQRFEKGTELYRISDLGRVWILADLFENEAQYIRRGSTARVSLPHENRVFTARVSDVLPLFDPATRTMNLRLETKNSDYALRPDMFVDVEFPVELPSAVTVPTDAVLDSGLRKIVFVERASGVFEPRVVEIGWRFGERVQIVRGLALGEHVVVSGNFFVDSESRLRGAAADIYNVAVKDPVCGMMTDQSKAAAAGRKTEYRGVTYYFCSESCKRNFDKESQRYAKEFPDTERVSHAPAPVRGSHD
jgi:membrane fusion protein, copper/silver efflux system